MSKNAAFWVGAPLALASLPFNAFVMLKLWVWFAAPMFHLMPANKWQLYGLFVLLSYGSGIMSVVGEVQKEFKDGVAVLANSTKPWFRAGIALLTGAAIKWLAA